jgi:hypothetical protein
MVKEGLLQPEVGEVVSRCQGHLGCLGEMLGGGTKKRQHEGNLEEQVGPKLVVRITRERGPSRIT